MKDSFVILKETYRIVGIESDRDRGGIDPANLNGALVKVVRLGDPHHEVELLPEYEHRWPQRVFYVTASKLNEVNPPTAEELEAAKRRTTELVGELESL